jgi:hypothetical protein
MFPLHGKDPFNISFATIIYGSTSQAMTKGQFKKSTLLNIASANTIYTLKSCTYTS